MKVGRIEYLYSGGVGEIEEFENAEEMIKTVHEESYYGVPMSIVIYSGESGPLVPVSTFADLDCAPCGFRVE